MAEKYSLWLVPDEGDEEHRLLSSWIQEHSARFPDAPVFRPHVTLLDPIRSDREESLEAAADVAGKGSPVRIKLVRPHISTTRTQCFFLLADPTTDLMELHQEAAGVYGVEAGMYFPHLSLLYSDIPVGERRGLVEEFDTDRLPLQFTAEKLLLVDTGGDVEDWESVGEFSLL